MIIYGTSEDEIVAAFDATNQRFADNLTLEFWGGHKSRGGGETYNVRLGVKRAVPTPDRIDRLFGARFKPALPGARRSFDGTRRLASACWHAYGVFLDSLPKGRKVVSPGTITNSKGQRAVGRRVFHSGDPWQDRNIGSFANPILYSEACDCDYYSAITGVPTPAHKE
jgi:hypothetical protein